MSSPVDNTTTTHSFFHLMDNSNIPPVDPNPDIGSTPSKRGETHFDNPSESLLKQILEVLQNSTIAEERGLGSDVLSKFWAAYKKVSTEYDSGMLERCNSGMDVLLIFAGLFSAVNTAFIIAMQPNPVDTTNALLAQLIQTTLNGSSTVQPTTLSAPTGYSSAYVWAQALAYASLAFSLLAAFGAVLAKQWIGHYKTNCYGSGSLEARCKQRHRKFQKLQSCRFEHVLHLFPVLIEISLLLFTLSLGAAMWTQHQAISILIIATAGLGVLCLIFTIVKSAISPDFPFQTSVSSAIRATVRYFRKDVRVFRTSVSSAIQAIIPCFRDFRGGSQMSVSSSICDSEDSQSPHVASTVAAMQWILQTSTDPDVVDSTVELMLTMSEDVSIESVCGDVRDMFMACFDHHGRLMHRDGALAYGKVLMHLSWKNDRARTMLEEEWNLSKEWSPSKDRNIWTSWRSLYLPCELDQCLVRYNQTNDAALQEHAKADLRTALRTVVTIGIDGFTYPDDHRLIWSDRFRLHPFRSEKDISRFVDQLMKYVKHFHEADDFEVVGDVLLLASGIATIPDSDRVPLSKSAEALKVIDTIASLRNTIGPRWSCIILGVVRRLHKCLASAHSDEIPSQAVLTALCPPDNTETYVPGGDLYQSWLQHATRLLRFDKWPKDHHLKDSSLSEIQHLVLRALGRLPTPKVDNAAKFVLYCDTLSHLMHADNLEFRQSALRAAFNIRQELVLIGTAGFNTKQQNAVFSGLSNSLLAVVNGSSTPIKDFPEYLPLISTLARNYEWRGRLREDHHDKRCATLIPAGSDLQDMGLERTCFYLAQCFLSMAPPTNDTSCGLIGDDQWWFLAKMAWCFIEKSFHPIDDALEIIPTLVESTKIIMQKKSLEVDIESFRNCLEGVITRLRQKRSPSTVISAVTGLKGIVMHVGVFGVELRARHLAGTAWA